MIWVIAGTEKGRVVTERLLQSGYRVVATTSTSFGSSLISENENLLLRHGALDSSGMENLVKEHGIKLIIDASHPYSEEVKYNVHHAAEKMGIPILELGRAQVSIAGAVEFDSYSGAADYVSEKKGNVLLTIGSKNIRYFHERGKQKIYARVLPVESSLAACADAGFPPDRIIAMQHTFSLEFEKALMKEFQIKYLVTKESGVEGGVIEKTEAAIQSGIEIIVIKRPVTGGVSTYFDIDEIIAKTGEIING